MPCKARLAAVFSVEMLVQVVVLKGRAAAPTVPRWWRRGAVDVSVTEAMPSCRMAAVCGMDHLIGLAGRRALAVCIQPGVGLLLFAACSPLSVLNLTPACVRHSVREELTGTFKLKDFRPLQKPVINCFLARKDSFVLLPTVYFSMHARAGVGSSRNQHQLVRTFKLRCRERDGSARL